VVDADMVLAGRFLVYLPVSPGFAIGSNGEMYAVWADGRSGDSDILLRRSTDDGKTSSKPVQVNRGTVGDGIPEDMPVVSVAPAVGSTLSTTTAPSTAGAPPPTCCCPRRRTPASRLQDDPAQRRLVEPQDRPPGFAVLPGSRLRHPYLGGLAVRRRVARRRRSGLSQPE
jgi:hypothetical protein